MQQATNPKRRRGRPPRRFDGAFDTRTALVRQGVAVLTEKGFAATGIDEVLREVGVPKGSFYHYFDSKEAFVSEVIDAYAGYFARKIDRTLTDQSMTPVMRVRAMVADAGEGMRRFDFRRGCLIGNLGQEMATLPEAFRDQLEETLRDWESRLRKCLEEARKAGETGPTVDCALMASCFWTGWEGAVLRAKLTKSADPLNSFAEMFLECLRH